MPKFIRVSTKPSIHHDIEVYGDFPADSWTPEEAIRVAAEGMDADVSELEWRLVEVPDEDELPGDVGDIHLFTRDNPKPTSTTIQTVLFSKSIFTKRQAQAFARKQGWKNDVDDIGETVYRLRQRPSTSFQPGSFRTIFITNGVQAVVGRPKVRKPRKNPTYATTLLEEVIEGRVPSDDEVQALAKHFAKSGDEETARDSFIRNLSGRFHGDADEYSRRRLGEVWRATQKELISGTRRNPELPRGSVSAQAARMLAEDIGLSLNATELEEFRRGLEVEHEHFHTARGNWNTIAKIVADHLDEDPNYYDKMDYWKAYGQDVDLDDEE
jgi:hypothetical protein